MSFRAAVLLVGLLGVQALAEDATVGVSAASSLEEVRAGQDQAEAQRTEALRAEDDKEAQSEGEEEDDKEDQGEGEDEDKEDQSEGEDEEEGDEGEDEEEGKDEADEAEEDEAEEGEDEEGQEEEGDEDDRDQEEEDEDGGEGEDEEGTDKEEAAEEKQVSLEGKMLRENRTACPYYQASGCILDQLEKSCPKATEEMTLPSAPENVWMCCCPKPYVRCTKEEANAKCLDSFRRAAGSSLVQKKGPAMLDGSGLLAVRRELLASEPKCSSFVHLDAKEAKCGKWDKAMPKLMCEMLMWQWEELGDGNEAEFDNYHCPMYKDLKAKEGDSRKMNTLDWDPRKL